MKAKTKKILKGIGITAGVGVFVFLGYKYVTNEDIPVNVEDKQTYFDYIKSIETPEEMSAFLIGYKHGKKYSVDDPEFNELLVKQSEKLLTEIPHK